MASSSGTTDRESELALNLTFRSSRIMTWATLNAEDDRPLLFLLTETISSTSVRK